MSGFDEGDIISAPSSELRHVYRPRLMADGHTGRPSTVCGRRVDGSWRHAPGEVECRRCRYAVVGRRAATPEQET